MARNVDGTADELETTTFVVIPNAGTLSFWWKPAVNPGNGDQIRIFE